jgi:hypothetical protein
MRLVKPSFEIWDRSGDPLALIERAGRVCYQSEPKGDPEGFVRRIIKSGHYSVLEHAWFAVDGWDGETPRFMEFDEESQLLLGNARALPGVSCQHRSRRRSWLRPIGRNGRSSSRCGRTPQPIHKCKRL